MKLDFINIDKVDLNNNCPVCYSKDGLQLTFMQKLIETALYKSVTSEITHKMECTTCNSIIYPERWTEDIERVFDYHQKAFVPKERSLKLKKNAWLIITSLVILLITLLIIILF